MPERCKLNKKKSSPKIVGESPKIKKASRMERFKMALPERPSFLFKNTSKLNLKKRPKLNIKRPNIHLPAVISSKLKRTPSTQEQQKQRSTKSTYGSHKNIFSHFSTYPRIFDRKAKNKNEYATSSPKETRAHVIESATYPRTKNTLKDKWGERFEENKILDDELAEERVAIERSRPWRHASLEEPRLAFRIQASESLEESEKLPWEVEQKVFVYQEEIQYADYEEGSQEPSDQIEDEGEIEEDDNNYEKNIRILKLKQIEAFNDNDFEDSTMNFRQIEIRNMSYEESSPGPSNAEQQSSGSSCEKRRRGITQETDSDNFSYREGDSRDDINVQNYLARNIQDLHKNTYTNSLTDIDVPQVPPQRPNRTRSMKKRKEKFFEPFNYSQPNQGSEQILQYSDNSSGNLNRTDSFSKSAHRIVYRAETTSREQSPAEYLDDIVILKPTRRKSKNSLRSQSEAPIEPTEIDGASELFPPTVPRRRKRTRNQNINGIDGKHIFHSVCNGHGSILENSFHDDHLPNNLTSLPINVQNKENLSQNLEKDFQVPPIPPKRRSHSRTASFVQDDSHSLHDVESIPGIEFADCDIPQDDIQEQLSGYAIIDKREKPPRPPPPRRRTHKSATTPRPTTPKRPQKTYSTLGPTRKFSPQFESANQPDMTQYANIESDEEKNINELLSKVQSRPLPAPPRPPRLHRLSKSNGEYYEPETVRGTGEAVASTQTDPLPDDEVIDEEITQAKLVMTHSRHGSQILISSERIPTPLSHTPPSLQIRQPSEDADSVKSEKISDRVEDEKVKEINQPGDILRTALLFDEPLRINNLEVGDLRVDRLSVSQLEAFKIAASEIDAIVVSASEMTGEGRIKESGINPALLQELVAIRNHLETVAQFQDRPRSRTEDACTATSNEEINKSSEEVLTSPKIESTIETGSGRVALENVEITETNKVVEQMPRLSMQTEILQKQVLQVENLKPESEINAEVGCTSSRETSVEKEKFRSSSRSSTPPCDHPLHKTTTLAQSIPPVKNTSNIRTTHETTSNVLPQRTIISHIDGREYTLETSQIPAQFFSLASPISQPVETEISLTETTRQLFRAIRIIGTRNLRHFVNYIASRVGREEASDKIREVELVLCALLLIVAGLLIMLFGSPRTVTHHHHWDYFNPPQ